MAERTYTLNLGETAATLPPAPLRSARSEDRVLQFCRSLGCPFGKGVAGRNKVSKFLSFRVSKLPRATLKPCPKRNAAAFSLKP